ncbi:MAG: hypothetical protein KF699_13155 [Phycisphaeraceae bacterium]|nr:hypothetical protein [Phycisphaeraceae bacterium]
MTTCVTPNNQYTNTPPNCYNGYPVGAFNPTGINQPNIGQPMQGNYVQGINNPQTQPFFGQPMNAGTPAFNSPFPQFFPGYFNTPQFSYGAYPIQNPVPAFNPFINGTTPWNINPFWNTTPWNTLPWQHVNSGPFQSWQNGPVPGTWNNTPFFGQAAFGQPSFYQGHAVPNFFNHNVFNPNFSSPGSFYPQFNSCGTPGMFSTPWNLSTQPVFNSHWNTPVFNSNFGTPWNTTNMNPFVNTFPTANIGAFINGTPSITPNFVGTPWTGILNTLGTLCQPNSWSAPFIGTPWTNTLGTMPAILNTAQPYWNSTPNLYGGIHTPWSTPNFGTFGMNMPFFGQGTMPFAPVFGGTFNPYLCGTPVNGYAPTGHPQGAPINPNFMPGSRPVTENGDYAGRGTI